MQDFPETLHQSPSRIDIDNKDPNGNGTLLHVMKRAPKDWVSFLKESIKFALRPLNHLIAIGPKLDENILHIRASSFEWTAIF